ncbi:hypothetical protein SOV_38600 [Sporomusa ovata DSM 2662]|uniref:Predicted transcriptional regulators n=1 Tax=Sporomusa ovata TaxID=2378 RepID=A0A0U1KST2_9FIRM|nr:Ig-like domain-containing protein [Sporomusa ovata]EQB26248.1 bacterial Ig-like domain containing protein [Sporomusa ovata DSM 2662]CQR70325.1 Predicted transcriptional regulators [Sporomusa ovata]
MKIFKKHVFIMLFAYVLTVLFVPAVFAQAGDADAGQKPFNFISATFNGITNLQGATNVILNPQIVMEFDKNLVDDAVWINNKNGFSLRSEDDENVAINVTRVDPKVDFNQRQKVFIHPIQALKAGTTYYLKASPNLLAKNGNSTLGATTAGQGITISFKTLGQAAPKPVDASEQGGTDSANTNTDTNTDTNTNTNTNTTTNSTTNDPVSTLTKATTLLNRTSTLLQSILLLMNSVGQFKLPLG